MRKSIISTIIVLFHFTCHGQINKGFRDFESQINLKTASISLCIIDSTGKVLFGNNENKYLIPASCLKVITTASALEILGADYQFKTNLSYSGQIENGKLRGDLYITGSGDPTLGSKHFNQNNTKDVQFQRWADKIKLLNIEEVLGNVLYDIQYFSDNEVSPTWLWEDIGNYYGAAATALNYGDNEFEVVFNGDRKKGEATSIVSHSDISNTYIFHNDVIASDVNQIDDAYIFGGPFEKYRLIKGSIPAGKSPFKIKGAIPYPPYFTTYSFNNILKQNKISTRYVDTMYFQPKQIPRLTLIDNIKSPLLKDIVYVTNQKSNNLYAECMLKTIGKIYMHEGSTQKGIESLVDFWSKKGLDINQSSLQDGSGLSRLNAVSTFMMSMLMHKMTLSENFNFFYNSLPVSGVSGTLSNFCIDENCKGKIIAKSGTMEKVMSYTGYVKTKTKGMVSFSIIINNYSGKAVEVRKSLVGLFHEMIKL